MCIYVLFIRHFLFLILSSPLPLSLPLSSVSHIPAAATARTQHSSRFEQPGQFPKSCHPPAIHHHPLSHSSASFIPSPRNSFTDCA